MSRPKTKDRLLDAGLALLLRRGYHDLGVQALLDQTDVPKGAFYHHFQSKEDFALAAVDRYMADVHAGLAHFLEDESRPPLERIRAFFEATEEKYRGEEYLGCLLGGLGQELSGVSETFRLKVEQCFTEIARALARCLALAKARGELAPTADPDHLAALLVNCWEGAALRTRLLRDPAPLRAMLDFFFRAASAP